MFKSILVAVAAAALVSAQSILSVTSPLGGNVYTAGGQAMITWLVEKESLACGTVRRDD